MEMNEESARKLLNPKWLCSHWFFDSIYYSWWPDEDFIVRFVDEEDVGSKMAFTIEIMDALIWWMRNKKGQ